MSRIYKSQTSKQEENIKEFSIKSLNRRFRYRKLRSVDIERYFWYNSKSISIVHCECWFHSNSINGSSSVGISRVNEQNTKYRNRLTDINSSTDSSKNDPIVWLIYWLGNYENFLFQERQAIGLESIAYQEKEGNQVIATVKINQLSSQKIIDS